MTNKALWVDSRVGSKELLGPLLKLGLPAGLAQLDSADFAFTGFGPEGDVEVGVERKTISDLVGSLRSARLQGVSSEGATKSQRERMLETYEYPFLMIEGGYSTDRNGALVTGAHRPRRVPGGYSEDSLNKAILSLSLRGGLWVKETANSAQSARWLNSLFRSFTDKKWDQHSTLKAQVSHETVTQLSPFRDIVMRFGGIGFAASKAVEDLCMVEDADGRHASLNRLLTLGLEALENMEVPTTGGPRRLGPAKAVRILQAIRRIR